MEGGVHYSFMISKILEFMTDNLPLVSLIAPYLSVASSLVRIALDIYKAKK